jgi:hypothetical protein
MDDISKEVEHTLARQKNIQKCSPALHIATKNVYKTPTKRTKKKDRIVKAGNDVCTTKYRTQVVLFSKRTGAFLVETSWWIFSIYNT